MISLTLEETAQILSIHCPDAVRACFYHGVSTDTRTLPQGSLYVALRGDRTDGHQYLLAAQEKGAVAALVDRPVVSDLPTLQVADTRKALGVLAGAWRHRIHCPIVALTGSNGKTTTKELTAQILRTQGEICATAGNYNNEIGVPLTLFGLSPTHQAAVLELGANHPGEIAYLTQMVRPKVALITNAGPAHLAGFGSIAGVAKAKGEIFSGLPQDGVAVINQDDPYAPLWRSLAAPRKILSFGLREQADIQGHWQHTGQSSQLSIKTPYGAATLSIPLLGEHNAYNVLGAAAVAIALALPLEAILQGLQRTNTVPGRLNLQTLRSGVQLLDDTYNANPASVGAALAVLANFPKERWIVLGDLAELGEEAFQYHTMLGQLAQESGVSRFFGVGQLSAASCQSFGQGAQAFEHLDDLLQSFPPLPSCVTVLIKGSRMMHMERVVQHLIQEYK